MLRFATYILSTPQTPLSVPLLDLAAYGGYLFVHIITQVIVGTFTGHWGYYAALAWGTLCMGVFLVKTMKRIFFSQTRHSNRYDTRKQNYMLLTIAVAQLPLAYWMGYLPSITTT